VDVTVSRLTLHSDAHETFFDFQNQSGWASPGVATLVGIIGPVATFIGGDSAVKDAYKREKRDIL